MRFIIHGGEDLAGIDIGAQTTPVFKVSGRVSTTLTPQAPPPTAQGAFAVIAQNQNATIQLMLMARDLNTPWDGNVMNASVSVNSPTSGQFEILNVRPGSYDLLALFADTRGLPALSRTVLDVRDRDVGGLVLTVRAGVEARGTVTVDGRALAPDALHLILQPADTLARLGGDASLPVTISPNGTFTAPGVPDGRFKISVGSLPPDLYVEDIRQNNVSVYDMGFEVRSGAPDPIQVLVKSGAATLEGTARDASGKPVLGAAIVLVPATRRENRSLYFTASADAAGKFLIRGIAPGDYKLFAWESISPTAYYNGAFLEKYEDRGIPMTLASGARANTTVTVSPR